MIYMMNLIPLFSLIIERIRHVGKTVSQTYNGIKTFSNEVTNIAR